MDVKDLHLSINPHPRNYGLMSEVNIKLVMKDFWQIFHSIYRDQLIILSVRFFFWSVTTRLWHLSNADKSFEVFFASSAQQLIIGSVYCLKWNCGIVNPVPMMVIDNSLNLTANWKRDISEVTGLLSSSETLASDRTADGKFSTMSWWQDVAEWCSVIPNKFTSSFIWVIMPDR